MNRIRIWFSGFWRKHKGKIMGLGKGAFFLILISFIATVIISSIPKNSEEETKNVIYKPTSTVLTGKDVSKEDYKKNSGVIDEFIQYCNSKDVKNAYNLISDGCKEIFFPTQKEFEDNYLNIIFSKKRTYNLQSWIVKEDFVTYRIRMLDDLLSTGDYTDSVKYEDYITIDNSNENSKISVNGFVKKEKIDNLETQTNEFYARVIEKITYIDYEEYTVTVKNLTENTVIMDSLDSFSETVLVGENDVNYYIEDIKEVKLLGSRLKPQITRNLKLKFKKNYSSSVKSDYIEFKNIIKNADEYEITENYMDKLNLRINL